MFYEIDIPIPPNTPRTAPVFVDLPVHPGSVNQVEVFFPHGCAGLAHFYVTMWGHQVWPSNPDSFFTGDGIPTVFGEDLRLVDPPFTFQIVAWNDDDTYPHTPILRVNVLPEDDTLTNLLARLSVGLGGPIQPQGGL